MDKRTAQQIGGFLAIKSSCIGLIIAYVLYGYVNYSWDHRLYNSVFWIIKVEYLFNLLVGAIGLILMAWLFGQLAGIAIPIKKKNAILTGIKYGFVILITATLIGSSVAFFQEGLKEIGGFSNPFFDYFFKPLYWVTMFGMLPVIVVGIWFGKQVKKQEAKL